MVYYLIGLYVLLTLWYSTHCKDCYFSKSQLVINHDTSRSNITDIIPIYRVQTCSVHNYSI